MNEHDLETWLALMAILCKIEWSIMQREQQDLSLTAAAQHVREAGHALRFGCCAGSLDAA